MPITGIVDAHACGDRLPCDKRGTSGSDERPEEPEHPLRLERRLRLVCQEAACAAVTSSAPPARTHGECGLAHARQFQSRERPASAGVPFCGLVASSTSFSR